MSEFKIEDFDLNKEYKIALRRIRQFTRLRESDLSLIQRVELRRRCEAAIDLLVLTEPGAGEFSPGTEAATNFVYDNFGVDVYDTVSAGKLNDIRLEMFDKHGYDALRWYFRKKNEDSHLL